MRKVKVRVMGEPVDVQRFAEELVTFCKGLSESDDYPNRRGDGGVRRYVAVEVSHASSANIIEDRELLPVRPGEVR